MKTDTVFNADNDDMTRRS